MRILLEPSVSPSAIGIGQQGEQLCIVSPCCREAIYPSATKSSYYNCGGCDYPCFFRGGEFSVFFYLTSDEPPWVKAEAWVMGWTLLEDEDFELNVVWT